jgi:Kef-type K+ transport system membrane component KefB
MEQSTQSNSSKKTLGIVVGMVAFALASFGIQQLFFKPSFEKAMKEAASEIKNVRS